MAGSDHFLHGLPQWFADDAVKYHSEECLTWPFGKNGSGIGMIIIDGRTVGVHRYVCELAHGAPPTPEHEAAHSCGNGHLACINPMHLRWATPKENADDREAHGRTARGHRQGLAKLTDHDVRRARTLAPSMTVSNLARLFKVDRKTIRQAVRGQTWSHV